MNIRTLTILIFSCTSLAACSSNGMMSRTDRTVMGGVLGGVVGGAASKSVGGAGVGAVVGAGVGAATY